MPALAPPQENLTLDNIQAVECLGACPRNAKKSPEFCLLSTWRPLTITHVVTVSVDLAYRFVFFDIEKNPEARMRQPMRECLPEEKTRDHLVEPLSIAQCRAPLGGSRG